LNSNKFFNPIFECPYFFSQTITIHLNRSFFSRNIPIRIIETLHVPETFHARFNAKSRTYLYRLAIAKREANLKYIAPIPIEEIQRCCFIQNTNFDVDKLKHLSQKFVGKHDFRTFMSLSKHNRQQEHPSFAVRSITQIEVTKGIPLTTEFNEYITNDYYDFWNITIKGPSFLYKQVRRIVGTLIAASLNNITERDVHEMLTIPNNSSWLTKANVAPAHALYLCKVEYDENDLKFKTEEEPETESS
jgi:tRNA pseudouridine(38-40) synthase